MELDVSGGKGWCVTSPASPKKSIAQHSYLGFWNKVKPFAAENYTPFKKHVGKNTQTAPTCYWALEETASEHVTSGAYVATLSFMSWVAIPYQVIRSGGPAAICFK